MDRSSALTWWRWSMGKPAPFEFGKEMLDAFLRHRRGGGTRRTVYELRKARSAAHFWKVSRSHWRTSMRSSAIKASAARGGQGRASSRGVWTSGALPDSCAAPVASARGPTGKSRPLGIVAGGYRLTETQAQAILDMRLKSPHRAQHDKIIEEYQEMLGADSAICRISWRARSVARSDSHGARIIFAIRSAT